MNIGFELRHPHGIGLFLLGLREHVDLLDMWLQPRLFFVVLDEERQVLGPVVLKVAW